MNLTMHVVIVYIFLGRDVVMKVMREVDSEGVDIRKKKKFKKA